MSYPKIARLPPLKLFLRYFYLLGEVYFRDIMPDLLLIYIHTYLHL